MTEAQIPSFAVVISAYNEEAGIEACVRAVDAALSKLPNRTSLIVVDDGSSDGTEARLAALADEYPRLAALRHVENRGYGAGLRSGTLAAAEGGFEYVVFMDSDLTNDPAYLPDFARWMSEGCDVVKASRYVQGGGVAGVPQWRVGVSVVGNVIARLLFRLPLRDCTNGFRAIRTRLLVQIDLREDGFAVIMEELHRLRPLARSYGEVPIVLTARTGDLRASSFSFGPRAIGRYLKYPLMSAFARIRGAT
jgi:dolichol-phosphate mannosyltransferase